MNTTSSRSTARPSRNDAHGLATSTPLDDILRTLVQNLGKKVIAHIVDRDTATIERWMKSSATLSNEAETALRNTFQVYRLLAEADDPYVARAWFLGMNPGLDDLSPVEALQEKRYREVAAAARTYINAA